MYNPYEIVRTFEREVAEFAGAPHAVAVDTGTAAILVCCQLLQVEEVTLPARTYPSVPQAVIRAGGRVRFEDFDWAGEYSLAPYPIIDSACRFRRNMHVPGTYRCLSFNIKKHVPIGRGGMILCDDPQDAKWLRRMRFHGRREIPLMKDSIELIGWPFVMDPERAARGLTWLYHNPPADDAEDLVFEYPDLSRDPAFTPPPLHPDTLS